MKKRLDFIAETEEQTIANRIAIINTYNVSKVAKQAPYPLSFDRFYDKISRLIGCSALIENGTLQFPKDEKPWWADFKKELLGFPSGKYKDQVDALTQCINYAMSTT